MTASAVHPESASLAIGESVPDHLKRYFLLRGHPRSGTNWVGRLLNLHPRISCNGELHLNTLQAAFDNHRASAPPMKRREEVMKTAQARLHDLVRACIREAAADEPCAIWIGDRTPAPLRMLLPGVRAILVVRDGRDVAVSWTYHHLRGMGSLGSLAESDKGMARAIAKFRVDPEYFVRNPRKLLVREAWVRGIGRAWAQRINADLDEAERVNGSERENRVLIVRYESLHEDIEAQRRQLYAFLGLDPGEASPVASGDETTPGLEREDPTSFRRKGEVGDWKRYFSDKAKTWFEQEAGPALQRLGYTRDANW